MRLLLAIPHYVSAGSGAYGSTAGDVAGRARLLETVLNTLHQTFGTWQSQLLRRRTNTRRRVNRSAEAVLDIVVCTTDGAHALEHVRCGRKVFTHRPTDAEPMMLGFTCHDVLAERLGDYDWYGYLEDDLVLADPLFFAKLAWFVAQAGEGAVLLPHRWERQPGSAEKLYIDGHLDPEFAAPWRAEPAPRLELETLGMPVAFEQPHNPHAGCFFLTAAQMASWSERPWFADRDTAFAGPLESAATLGILKTFRLYKPAPENAGFLEVLHAGTRYLARWLTDPQVPRQPRFVP